MTVVFEWWEWVIACVLMFWLGYDLGVKEEARRREGNQ